MLRSLCVALVALVTATVVSPSAARAGELWTDPPAKRVITPLTSMAPLVDKLEPAVLVIFTEGDFSAEDLPPGHPPLGEGGPGMPPAMPEGFDPDNMPEMRGQGAGFVITPTGYALTNHHVVEHATSIVVRVGDDPEEFPATVVGSDEKTDVALIKIDSPRSNFPIIPLGDSDVMKVGDFVVAIGSPFGLEQSVSFGIVSGRGRKDIAPSGRVGLYDFVQTDASINPGNSGGPLLNLYGEAIGMNSAVNAAGSGIGFAIPINMVKKLLGQLKAKGRYERSWIGVSIQEVPDALFADFGLDRARGALVREVVPEGPAAAAGVLPGDVIVAFEGKRIEDSYELPLLAGEGGVGKSVKIDILRDKLPKQLQVVLGGHPDNATGAVSVDKPKPAPKDRSLGVTVVSLDNDDRERLKLKKDLAGTRVTKVRPGGAAFLGGLLVDDVVLSVNGTATRTANDFAAAVKAENGDLALKMQVQRQKSVIFVAVQKP